MGAGTSVQVDFVNDIPYRHGEPLVTKDRYLIDTVENILANKLTAIIGRDNPKDIFDLLLIHSHYTVSWPDILDAAHKKAGFSNDELVIRIQTFPRHNRSGVRLQGVPGREVAVRHP